ncbi:MAG: Ig domain-containing protein [Oscillospiraceae bacterium]|nr:Ig domain-containing protein [Oscillospiraceae bacterium]
MKKILSVILCALFCALIAVPCLTAAAVAAVGSDAADGVWLAAGPAGKDFGARASVAQAAGDAVATAAAIGSVSGNKDIPAPTDKQIADRWFAVSQEFAGGDNIYTNKEGPVPPNTLVGLNDDYKKYALAYLNFYRYAARLPELKREDYNAQYGALLLATINQLNHEYSPRPSGMSVDTYNKAFESTKHSNIGKSDIFPTRSAAFRAFIDVCFSEFSGLPNDPHNRVNITTVPHRRWFLKPTLQYTDFGQVETRNGEFTYFTADVVHDDSLMAAEPLFWPASYDFIAWPPSGNMPAKVFDVKDPWSVMLNPDKCYIANVNDVTVKMTRVSDGAVFTLTSANVYTAPDKPFLYVDTNTNLGQLPGYGPNISFNIGADKFIKGLVGDFTVEITGIRDKGNGSAVTLTYGTSFLDVYKVDTTLPPVNGVTLSPTAAALYVNETKKLTAMVTPANARDKGVYWESKDPGVATVNSRTGLVTAVGPGTATITVQTNDGWFTDSCVVTVSIMRASGVTLNKTELSLNYQESEALIAAVVPANTTDQRIKWTSDNPAAASVDANGRVTANARGTAKITVTTDDGGFTKTCTVNVGFSWWQWLIYVCLFGWAWGYGK